MGLCFSFIFDDPHVVRHVGVAAGVTGQNLALLACLKELVKREEVEALEVLVDPRMLADQEAVTGLALSLLPPELRGKGKLEILPSSHIPEIWGDGKERIIFSHDLITLVRDRQLRDRWAAGPSPIFWDTHNQAPGKLQLALAGAKGISHVPYDRILCISDYVRQGTDALFRLALPSQNGGAPADLEVLPRALKSSEFRPAESPGQKIEFRKLHGLPVEGKIAVFMSRLTPSAKADLAPLIESFVQDAREGERLVIAGPENSPGYIAALKQLIPDSRRGQVLLMEHIRPEERRSFLAACDFFVFPGDFLMEGAGLAIMEALCCGLPVVCSDLDGFREAVEHEENGLRARTVILPGFERAEWMAGVSSFFLDGIQQAQCVWIDHEAFMAHFWRMMREDKFRLTCSANASSSTPQRYDITLSLQRVMQMAEESLAMARADLEGRRRLCQEAAVAGPPALFWEIFRFGGSEEASLNSVLKLTEKGRQVLTGVLRLEWYADILPYVNRTFHAKALDQISEGPVCLESLVKSASAMGLGQSDAVFQLALLLKQNCVALEVTLK